MNAASNALGVVAAVIWFGVGLYVLRRARSLELSWRALFGLALVLAAGFVLEVVRDGLVGWFGGFVLLAQALVTWWAVATRTGRRTSGLDGWGITTHTAHLDEGKGADRG